MKTLGLVANRQLPPAQVSAAVGRVLDALRDGNGGLWILDNGALPVECQAYLTDRIQAADVVIALGGDGTMLATARLVAGAGIPVLGVRMGRLGFLSEVEPEALRDSITLLFQGKYRLERRSMLAASVSATDGLCPVGIALNDFVITKGTLLRPISTRVRVDGEEVTNYLGDGVIVATPTGSTAYSLSAGGPLLTPDVQGILITPLCAHSVVARSIIVGPSSRIEVELLSARKGAILVTDGQESHELVPGDIVVIREAPTAALLVRFDSWSFLHILRERLANRG